MAMHDVEKTAIRTGYKNAKRMRRRRRFMPIYIFTVLLLTACLGMALSMTLFFNVSSIKVTGTAPQYSAEEITMASGVGKGDNLLRMNVKELENNIESDMIYIESATVSKKYPDAVTIDVKSCHEAYNIYFDNGILMTSGQQQLFTSAGEQMIYSASRQVDYQGAEVEVCVFFDSGSGYTKGVYTVDAYTTEGKLGSADLLLK